MKKYAMTSLEVLIAMSLVVAATLLGINSLRVYINKDTDISKFKHAFGSLSEAIYSMKHDSLMYPKEAKGFEDTDTYTYVDDNISYGGTTKFKNLFTSKFNVLENNVQITFSQSVPLIKYEDESKNVLYKTSKKLDCFIENKGFMLCPPEISLGSKEKLVSIYVPVYVNQINTEDSNTTDINKAIFVEIYKRGKIDIPASVEYYPNSKIIDCTNKEYNSYSQCKILDKMTDIDF